MGNEISWVLEVEVNEGKLDEFRTLMEEMVGSTKGEPGALIYEWFIGDDNRTVHIYERYADSSAVLAHLGNFGAKFAPQFLGAIRPTRFTVFGSPSDDAKAGLSALAPSFLSPFGGFAR
ncbi:MAG TPA: antibiotic biosynthesis monooxygenase family protein [Acidimicrobiia bacterium]|nr:antibiotic biosynthesis monooxygenase family protein [Acidimicrobiia bacterium]